MTTDPNPTDAFAKGKMLECVESAYGLTPGRKYTSLEPSGNVVQVCADDDRPGHYFKRHFRPVATEPVKECAFKVGDRVKHSVDDAPGDVLALKPGMARVDFDTGAEWCIFGNLTLVSSAQPPAAEVGKAGPAPAKADRPDPYELHRESLRSKGLTENMVGRKTNETYSAGLARLRNIAALSKELAEPMSKRRARLARKYDGRPGIDDTGGFSGPGWEE